MYRFISFFHTLRKSIFLLLSDFSQFVALVLNYSHKKLLIAGAVFEIIKRVLVGGLIMKRGRFNRTFLHIGVASFFALGMIIAPVFATTYPIFSHQAVLSQASSPSAVLTSVTDGEPVLSTEVSPKPRDRVEIYKVQPGDTLSSIAQDYGISVDTILWENNLDSKTTLSPGQEIRILPVSGVSYKVLKGDTVYTIAKKFQTDAQKIVDFPFNDFADPDVFTLTAGQLLIVPDGEPPQAKPVAPKLPAQYILPGTIAGAEGFIWPTAGQITQYPIWYHMALDIANREGPPVGAAKAGVVTFASCIRGGYGCHVIVDNGNGFQTLYAHLSQIATSVGASLSKGQVLGRMGSTGRSTGTHLHFEIRKNGVLLNPLNFLK